MPALSIQRTALVTVAGTFLGQVWANVHAIRFTADGVFTDQEIADDIADAFNDAYGVMVTTLSNDWTATSCTIADIQSLTSPSFDGAWTTLTGTDTAQNLPPQMAAVASHRTGLRGKSYNGRTYLTGFTETTNDDQGQITSGTRGQIEAMFTNLRNGLLAVTSAPSEHAVASRKLLVSTPVTSTTVDPEWDRQNRRKRS